MLTPVAVAAVLLSVTAERSPKDAIAVAIVWWVNVANAAHKRMYRNSRRHSNGRKPEGHDWFAYFVDGDDDGDDAGQLGCRCYPRGRVASVRWR